MDLLNPQSGEAILDVGFGGGQALRFIADRVGSRGKAVGIESKPSAVESIIELKRSQDLPWLEVSLASGQSLPFSDGAFDAVLCVNVLEAIADRTGAVVEMRRVLKPGGRLLLAHDDYESQVYTTTDRELGRRAVLAYANATMGGYETSDGQMGRHLPGLARAAGFSDIELHVIPLVNLEYREPFLGWTHTQFSATFVSKVSDLTDQDLDRWRADLAEKSARGEYVYCVNLYACVCGG
jgi:SAM-dependent methyltransferase